VVRHARDAQKLGIAKRADEDMLERVRRRARTGTPESPSHGENRGSSPLGSANNFSILSPKWSLDWPTSPTFLQWTVRFRRSVRGHAVVSSKRPETIWAVTAVGGIDAYFSNVDPRSQRGAPRGANFEHPLSMRRRSELFSLRYVGGLAAK
jgi:hypothetical protein